MNLKTLFTTALLLLSLSAELLFAQIDTIGKEGNEGGKGKWINTFQLWEQDGAKISYLQSITAVENGILYGNHTVKNDYYAIIDLNEKLYLNDSLRIFTLDSIDRVHSNYDGPGTDLAIPSLKRGDTLFITDSTDLVILDVNDPSNPRELHRLTFPAEIRQIIHTGGDTIYVNDNRKKLTEETLHSVKYDGSSAPVIENSYANFAESWLIHREDRMIGQWFNYTQTWMYPLTSREEDSYIETETKAYEVLDHNGYIFHMCFDNVVRIYKYEDENTVTLVKTLDKAIGKDMVIYKNLLLVGGKVSEALTIWDISNPAEPVQKAVFLQSQYPVQGVISVDSSTNYAFIISYNRNWMDVLDLTPYLSDVEPKVTLEFDTVSFSIILDTTVTVDTTADSIVTTLTKENGVDTTIIRTDSLVNKAIIGSKTDTSAVLWSIVIDSTVDTLESVGIATGSVRVAENRFRIGKTSLAVPAGATVSEVAVFDLAGRQIFRKRITEGVRAVPFSSAPGIYVARVFTGAGEIVQRISVR